MKKITLAIFLLLYSLGSLASENEFKTKSLLLDAKNKGFLWLQVDDIKLVSSFILDESPHDLDRGIILVELLGIKNNGYDEKVVVHEDNIDYKHYLTIKALFINQKYDIECPSISDNIPKCLIYINKDFTINEYLLAKGLAKFQETLYIKDEFNNNLKESEIYARDREIGVWTPFYGIFKKF